ncbi:MAG: hypothetical protein AAB459_03350 [Patescibacteria group bacterium]
MRIRVGKIASLSWRVALIGLTTTIILWTLFGFRLRSLSPGVSPKEQEIVSKQHSLSMIMSNPVYAPYNSSQLILQKVNKRSVFVNRFASALVVSSTVIAFFILLIHIATKRIAVFGTLLFASSSFTLHFGRSGTTDMLPFVFVLFLAGCAHLAYGKKLHKTVLAGVLLCFGLLIYVPGLLWLLVPLLIWQYRRILSVLQEQPLWFMLGFVSVAVISVLPLVWGTITNPSSLLELLLIPEQLPSIKSFFNGFGLPFQHLFFKRQINPSYWLNPTPILDATLTILCMLGLYVISFQKKLDRFWFLVVSFIIVSVFSGLGSIVLMPVFVVLIYVVITLGLALIMQQWQTVFPKNPFIKSITLSLSLALVVGSVGFQTTRYFRAWANSPATKKAMVQPRP